VDDLRTARASIDCSIVTKGNIDLGLLLEGSPEACAAAAREVLDATAGYPHLVGAADAILYGTPVENVRAVEEVCRQSREVRP
jgi:uroporphyrinogen-III decarboxylase